LYVLLELASPPTWVHICFGRKDSWITDAYVFGVLVFSVVTYFFFPSVWCAGFSTFFSASTVIALLHVVLLQRVFGPVFSPERSLFRDALKAENELPSANGVGFCANSTTFTARCASSAPQRSPASKPTTRLARLHRERAIERARAAERDPALPLQ
jgi:hypothetical protein